MPANQKVKFYNLVKPFTLNDKTRLKRFIERLIKKEGKQLQSISFIFCSDSYLLKINKKYLNRRYLTDTITFDLTDRKALAGEVYISVPRVKQNAIEFNTGFKDELHRVMFHGALHLCGYKDKEAKQIKRMRNRENRYLAAYFKN